MLQHKKLSGGGGGGKQQPTPKNMPDTLRSQDTLEMAIGVSIGPVKGPTNGDKSIKLGTTALQQADGDYNFDEVSVTVYPGEASPDPLIFKLGGASSNHVVNVPLAHNDPIVRQTTTGNLDFIQVRIVVGQLYKSVVGGSKPGMFDDKFEFRIRYRPTGTTEWAVWSDGSFMITPTNPYYSHKKGPWGNAIWNALAEKWEDAHTGESWGPGDYDDQLTWAQNQANNPGSGVIQINGKTTSTYVKEYRIPVQRIPVTYDIEIMQISADSDEPGQTANGTYHINAVNWESFQEIDADPKEYPGVAILQLVGKATDQFTSIPPISGEWEGLIVRVPNNYDPETREYDGIWDGGWKYEFTNNPIWLLYECITNTEWGWSAYSPVTWSPYEAYDLAQHCDYILPNGKPRYTYNQYMVEAMDGREFCRYLAGSVNAIIVDDNNGNVHVLMDRDDPAVAIFGNESIVGDFTYTYTDTNTRYNDITGIFLNPDLDYQEDRRRIYDQDQIDRFGRIAFDFVAVGCTDAEELARKVTRRLVSSTTETEMVTFRTNRRGEYVGIYDVVLVADSNKAQGLSGRFSTIDVDRNGATLRDPIYLESGITYEIYIQDAESVVTRTITNSGGAYVSHLTFSSALPATVYEKAQFGLSQEGAGYGVPKPYRILDKSMNGNNYDDWTLMGIEINRNKYAAEDAAEIVGEPVYTFVSTATPEAPTNITLTNTSHVAADGTFVPEFRVDFTPPNDHYVTDFQVRYRAVGEVEYIVANTGSTGGVVVVPFLDEYEVEVRTLNAWQQQSRWVPANDTVVVEKLIPIEGGGITSTIGGVGTVTVVVEYPDQLDVRYVHVYGSETNDPETAEFIGKADTDSFIDTLISGVQTKYYFTKFEDNLGNIGEFSSAIGIEGTSIAIEPGDLGDTLQQELQDARDAAEALLNDIVNRHEQEVEFKKASYSEHLANVTMDESLVVMIDTVSIATGANTAAIANEVILRTNADTAIALSVTSLTATVNANTAAIVTEASTRASADTALSNTITTLTSTVNANTAAITAEATTRANADTAISATVTTLTSTVNANTAAITAEATTRANADTAISATVTTLTSTVNGHTATITAQATALATLGQVYGTYSLSVNADGNIASMNLYAAGGIVNTSGVRFEVNDFMIKSATATAVVPFHYDAVAGKLTLNSVVANEIEATTTIKIGVGNNTVILDGASASDKRIAVGNVVSDAAPFWVSKTGKLKATDWELYDEAGVLMLSPAGVSESLKQSIVGSVQNALPTKDVVVGSLVHLPSTTTVNDINKVAARLGDNSPVSIKIEWDLRNAYGANYAAYPSSETITVYERYSTDGTSWGSWSSVGSQAFSKINSGSPTSTQYRVATTTETYDEYDGELHSFTNYSITYAKVDAGSPATFTITSTSKNAGYYEFCVVGGNASPFTNCGSKITLTDTDGVPSFIATNNDSTGSVPYANLTGSFKRLRIASTGATSISVTADWVFVSTPEGLPRTIANLNTTVDLSVNGALGRLDTGSIATNTWYYVWAVSDGSTDGAIVSTSMTSHSLSAYRYKALIGVVRTNSATATIKPFNQKGKKYEYVWAAGTELDMASGATPSNNTTGPSSGNWDAVSTSAFVPFDLTEELIGQYGANSGIVIIAPNNTYGGSASTTNRPPVAYTTSGGDTSLEFRMTLQTSDIYWINSHSSWKLICKGFILDI